MHLKHRGSLLRLTQHFSENENKNHADEESWLLSSTTDTSVTDDTNSETSSETSETDGETSTELDEASEERQILPEVVGDQDRDDETVDSNDTSHNDGNDVCAMLAFFQMQCRCSGEMSWTARVLQPSHVHGLRSRRTLDDQVRPEDTHGRDTDTSLCGTVGGTEAGEDDGGRAAHRSEERL